jgi:hypothetical protein
MGIGKGAGFGLLDERELEEGGRGRHDFFLPLQILLFRGTSLQFVKLDVCHCSSTRRRNEMVNFQYRSELQ